MKVFFFFPKTPGFSSCHFRLPQWAQVDVSDADGDFTGGGFLLSNCGEDEPNFGEAYFFSNGLVKDHQLVDFLFKFKCVSFLWSFNGAFKCPFEKMLDACLDEQDLLPTKISSVPQEVRPICHRRRGKLGGGFKDAIGRAYFQNGLVQPPTRNFDVAHLFDFLKSGYCPPTATLRP